MKTILRWVVLCVWVGAGWVGNAQPVTPPVATTTYTRGLLTKTNAEAARAWLGVSVTNGVDTNWVSAVLTNNLQNAAPTHETLFSLPTDDGSMPGVLHPSVWYGPTNWNGWRYWLFYSTWPGVEREAMFCSVSRDGVSWFPAPGTTDGRIGPNSADPEALMLDDGSLCVFYLYAGVGGTTNNIDYLRSFDGVTWTTNRAFTITNALAIGSAACPSIVRLADGSFRMWWHDKTTEGDGATGHPYSMAQIYTMTSGDGTNWSVSTQAACPGMTNGWHFDVARVGDTLYMLRCNEMPLSQGPAKVWTSSASDGTNWTHVPGFGLVLPSGLVGPYRADLVPTAAWPPTFDVWWNNWDEYNLTSEATNSTQRVGRMQGVTLPMQPLDWTRSNTLTMANSFFSSQASASTVMPFAYPWSVYGEGGLSFKYVANLGTGGLLYTNAASAWGLFGLDAFGYKSDAAGSLGGGLFQSYETMPKSPSQFRVEWQLKLLTNSAAQIGVYKYGTFGSSVGTLTNIAVMWDTTGTNMAYLCVTNGSTSQRVAFDGVPSVAGTSHTLESTLVTIEKTEWGKVTAKLYRYPTTYTATATFADTTALWWTPFVAWKGTVGIERFDLRTKVNNARGGASDLPSAAVLSANAISMMTNGPITSTGTSSFGALATPLVVTNAPAEDFIFRATATGVDVGTAYTLSAAQASLGQASVTILTNSGTTSLGDDLLLPESSSDVVVGGVGTFKGGITATNVVVIYGTTNINSTLFSVTPTNSTTPTLTVVSSSTGAQRVGVGVAAPTQSLDVGGTIRAANSVIATDNLLLGATAAVVWNVNGGSSISRSAASGLTNALLLNSTNSISLAAPIVTVTNGLSVSGLVTASNLVLSTPVWDDVRLPLSSMRGGAAAPSPTTFLGNTRVQAFADSAQQSLEWELQTPHGINTNNTYGIRLHLHWTSPSAITGVVWGVEYTQANPNGTFGATITNTVTVTNSTPYKHQIVSLATITNTVESAVIVGRVFRQNDSATGDAYGLSLDAHVPRNRLGSSAEMGDY